MSTNSFLIPDFFSSVSHELRSPIASIVSLSDLLVNDDEIDNKQKQDFVNDINYLALETLEFINDLLDVSQAENNYLTLCNLEKENIEKIITSSIRIVKGFALKNDITIISNIDSNLSDLNCDGKKIKQVLVNLLTNAIKYSFCDTEVVILAKNISQKLHITIKDQGIGMTSEELNNIYNIYHTRKTDDSYKNLNKRLYSNGIGLPLVKQIVDLHQGKIEFNSAGKNKGLEVVIIFNLENYQ